MPGLQLELFFRTVEFSGFFVLSQSHDKLKEGKESETRGTMIRSANANVKLFEYKMNAGCG